MYNKFNYSKNNRYMGGAVFPFIFGAITGGMTASYFNPYKPRPVYPYMYPFY